MKAPSHRVLYTHGGGRLGNQIVRFLHWMAWARDHDGEVEVLNLAFWPFAQFFAVWQEHPGCIFPVRNSWFDRWAVRAMATKRVRDSMAGRQGFQRAVHGAGRWVPGWEALTLDFANDEALDLRNPALLARVRRCAVTTCCGWRIADWRSVAERQAELRTWIRPAPRYARTAVEFVGRIRNDHDLVVGVLIRQSDYRTWDGGRFYFTTAQYARWMRQLLDLHAGKRVAFIVASEEWQEVALFAGLPVFLSTGTPNAGGHWFQCWAELSLCDVIVTPPSTFSATAAFASGLPLWPVVVAEQQMSAEQRIEDGLVGAARHPEFSRSVK